MALQFLPLLAGAAPGILSGLSNLFDKKRRKAEEGKASTGISQLVDVFKEQMGSNYYDSAEAQGAMTAIRENEQENLGQIDATANINGLTDEARIAMRGKQNKATAGAFSDLSRSADLWRRRNQQAYQGGLSQLFAVGNQNRQNFNNSMQNIFGPLQDSVSGAINSGLFDAPVKGISPGSVTGGATTGMASGLLDYALKNYKG